LAKTIAQQGFCICLLFWLLPLRKTKQSALDEQFQGLGSLHKFAI